MLVGTRNFPAGDAHSKDGTRVPAELEGEVQFTLELAQRIRDDWSAELGPGGDPRLRAKSVYRSPAHNRKVRKGKDGGEHPNGLAIDLEPVDRGLAPRFVAFVQRRVAEGAYPELGGLGVYDWGVHVDRRPRKASGGIARWDWRAKSGTARVARTSRTSALLALSACVLGLAWVAATR